MSQLRAFSQDIPPPDAPAADAPPADAPVADAPPADAPAADVPPADAPAADAPPADAPAADTPPADAPAADAPAADAPPADAPAADAPAADAPPADAPVADAPSADSPPQPDAAAPDAPAPDAPAPDAPPDEGFFKTLVEKAVASFAPVISFPGLGDFNMAASLTQAANQVAANNATQPPLLDRADVLLGEASCILDLNMGPNTSLALPGPTIGFSGKCCSADDQLKFRAAIEAPRNSLKNAVNAYKDTDRAVIEACEQGKKICYGALATCIIGTLLKPGAGGVPACLAGSIACIGATAPVQNAIRAQAKAEADLQVAIEALERALANHRNCYVNRCPT